MSKEEIKDYLKRVDELELKLVDEDRDTLQWLIFGYNECARLLNEKEKENQELKDRIDNTADLIKRFIGTNEKPCCNLGDLQLLLEELKGDKE